MSSDGAFQVFPSNPFDFACSLENSWSSMAASADWGGQTARQPRNLSRRSDYSLEIVNLPGRFKKTELVEVFKLLERSRTTLRETYLPIGNPSQSILGEQSVISFFQSFPNIEVLHLNGSPVTAAFQIVSPLPEFWHISPRATLDL